MCVLKLIRISVDGTENLHSFPSLFSTVNIKDGWLGFVRELDRSFVGGNPKSTVDFKLKLSTSHLRLRMARMEMDRGLTKVSVVNRNLLAIKKVSDLASNGTTHARIVK